MENSDFTKPLLPNPPNLPNLSSIYHNNHIITKPKGLYERKVEFLPSKRLRKHLKALKMFPMSWPENGGWKEVGDDRRWCSLVGMVLGWLTQ
jgi:hypothetical protein